MHKYLLCFIVLFSFTEHAMAADMQPANIKNFWWEVDGFVWKVWEKGVAATNGYAPILTTDNYTQNKAIRPHFSWDFGFRFGFGSCYFPKPWTWDLYWTNWRTSAFQKHFTNTNDLVDINQLGSFPIWNIGEQTISGDYASDAKMHWTLSLNLIDLGFNRDLKWGPLNLCPSLGLRNGWILQSFDIVYSGGIFLLAPTGPGVAINADNFITMNNNYWGIGPKIGLSPKIELNKGFALYASGFASSLLGRFHIQQNSHYLGDLQYAIDSSFFGWRWIVDATGGLMWSTGFLQNRYEFTMKLGYEFHQFYHQLELKRDAFNVAPRNSNFRTQGVSFDVRFDY